MIFPFHFAEVVAGHRSRLAITQCPGGPAMAGAGAPPDRIMTWGVKTKEVTQALSGVKDAYVNAANSVGAFNAASDSAKHFHDQIQVLTKNLSSLNTIYELELQESNNHLKSLNTFYGKLAEVSTVMTGTADDAKKVQEQVAGLANNLGRLNNIYGNMLTAMQGR